MRRECFDKAKAQNGFTLIELLIVVAIIVILASIALPNFLEAQVRGKVARAQAELHTVTTALEMYRADNVAYPPTPIWSLVDRDLRLLLLTTPVAYVSGLPTEVFERDPVPKTYAYWSPGLNDAMKYSPIYYYLFEEKLKRGRWALFSRGPDLEYEAAPEEGGDGLLLYYDATNGTTSNGDIMRFGP